MNCGWRPFEYSVLLVTSRSAFPETLRPKSALSSKTLKSHFFPNLMLGFHVNRSS